MLLEMDLVITGINSWYRVLLLTSIIELHARVEHRLYNIEIRSKWVVVKMLVKMSFRELVNKSAYLGTKKSRVMPAKALIIDIFPQLSLPHY